jgi:3-(3-hydroxy-phenyl)propionate hydroxylase
MSDQASASPDVLIVGAGPSGMITACALLQRGVRVRMVDSLAEPVPYSKALLLWPRTLDVFAELGIAGEVPAKAVRIDTFRYFSDRQQLAGVRFPPELASWALPQRATEDLLRGRLTELGGHVERGVRLLALDKMDFSGDPANSSAVTAVLEHPDGRVERCATPWLIGADGAGSAVRAQLGLSFAGATYENHWVLADAKIEGRLPANEAHYYQSPAGVLVIVALPGGLFRFFASAKPDNASAVDFALVQRLVDERGPGGIRLLDPEWVSRFRVHRRQADKFQLGRAFLLGDAAHVHSPAGGQGMNTGMQDGHNLAWKLADVIHGRASNALLESYTPERHQIAAQVVRDTDLQTRAWIVRNKLGVATRDAAFRLAHRSGLIRRAYLPVMAGRRIRYAADQSTALLAAPRVCERRGPLLVGSALPASLFATPEQPCNWTLITRGTLAATGLPDHVALRVAGPGLARAFGCSKTAFLLVRPDGFIAARGHVSDFPGLVAWLSALAGQRPVDKPGDEHTVHNGWSTRHRHDHAGSGAGQRPGPPRLSNGDYAGR